MSAAEKASGFGMAISDKQAALAVRRAQVAALRIERVPFAEIAERLEISDSSARSDWKRALEHARSERNAEVSLATVAELASLEAQEAAVWQVLRNRHVMVHNGQVVTRHAGYERDPLTGKIERDADGVPLEKFEEIEDDAPVLAAVDRLGKIGERQSSRRGRSSDAVESALRRQLGGMTEEIREGPLAQVALRLAAEVDAGLSARDAAALTRELRLTIARLEELSPAQGNGDIVDELAARRAERLAAAAEG